MRAYLSLFSARARVLFQYRSAAFAGAATQLFWGFMRVMIFEAFYQNAMQAPISLQETITYIWLSQAFLALLPWNLDREVEHFVRSGSIVYELVKPINLFWYWYSRSMAMRLIPTLLKSLPVIAIVALFFNLPLPPSSTSGLLFALSLIGALALSAAITTLVMISLFWTVSSEGVTRLLPAIVIVFSGMLVPLPLFPDWIQPFIDFLPFRGIIDTPFRLYSGNILPSQALGVFVHQWLWTIGLIGGGYMAMHQATKRLTVHGG